MPSWLELTQQLRQVINGAIRFVKARRREEASPALAALFFWLGSAFAGWLAPEFKEFLNQWRGVLIVQGVFYVAGLAMLVYSGISIWRLVYIPELPPIKDRPSVVKGPAAFTPEDGALFRKLGRENDLQKLLGYILDDQTPLVVLMGASGAGKTSLLRAGLAHILADKGVHYHYWEAVPTDSDRRLLRAIQETWNEPGSHGADDAAHDAAARPPAPAMLEALVNPSSELCRQPHVIVLDQFEQLRERNPVFRLLRKVAREAKPPHRITWVIAFRREFRATWADFIIPEQERGFYPPELSLRLFTVSQAQAVISQLIQEADLSIEQAVVDNLLDAATVDGEVSPVDIGIGLLILAELHDRQGGKTVTIRDYQFAGAGEGLLTQYINRCLERFPDTERETILKAMLGLRDAATNQRIAAGKTAEEIAAEIGAEARRLKPQLDRLVQRDIRLLETVTTPADATVRYRLPHERLIPALYRLTGTLLAEVDQATLRLEKAFLAWQNNDKRAPYLLKGRDLRLIERFATQIPWGSNTQEKQSFLQRSQGQRTVTRGVAVTVGLALLVLGWGAGVLYQRYEHKRYLRESGYPPALYVWQHQLKTLALQEPLDLERFAWLSSDSVEELSIRATSSSNSIAALASLARCRSLKKLTLTLYGTQVSTLEPLAQLRELTQLTLALSGSQVSTLEPLAQLRELTQLTLTLYRTQVSTLEPLAPLAHLQKLSLKSTTRTQRMSLRSIPATLRALEF